jgi:hypothetical protein
MDHLDLLIILVKILLVMQLINIKDIVIEDSHKLLNGIYIN